MEISRNFTTRKVSFDRVVSKISSQIPINRDWSRLTDRRVFPEESLVSTKIFLCAWRAVWPATGRFYWKRWISCSPSFDSPPFLPFSFRVFKINTINRSPPLLTTIRGSNVRKYSRCKTDLRRNFYSCYNSDYNSFEIIFR